MLVHDSALCAVTVGKHDIMHVKKGHHTAQGSRPKFPKNCVPEPIREIIRNCWHANFRQRPTFEAVIGRLEPLVERLPRRSRKGEGPCAQQ